MKRLFFTALILIGFSASAQQKLGSGDMKEIRNRMVGIFDNMEQSKADPSYATIILHGTEIDLKGKKNDGYWLYVEQDMSANGTKAYHQRIYNIYKHDKETVAAKMYEINNAEAFVGGWRNPDKFKSLRLDSLTEGCVLYFAKDERGNYIGSTLGKDCLNSLQGAMYTTTELMITPNMIVNWDRGWNAEDQQVWGAEKGGYKFRKYTVAKF